MQKLSKKTKIFLCHASEDKPVVQKLYRSLINDGFNPWLDKEDLLPGADWQKEISRAIRDCDVVVVCLSNNSVTKTGFIQKEIKFALDRFDEQPEGKIFIIPFRLEPCQVPDRLARWQWVDLFEVDGYQRLVRGLRSRDIDHSERISYSVDDRQYQGDDPNALLREADKSTALGCWAEAAHLYDEYCQKNPNNWEIHFHRAVAYANAGGEDNDMASLRAYNEAIALIPLDIDPRMRSRLHAYRGGILKRLNRLEEAEAQLHLAEKWAIDTYEKEDISYNFACIAAMKSEKQEMMTRLLPLMKKQWWRDLLASEIRYFANFQNDPEFIRLISSRSINDVD